MATKEQIERWLEACDSAATVPKDNGGPGFTDWELNFLASIQDQFQKRGSLSENQAEKLKQLFDKT